MKLLFLAALLGLASCSRPARAPTGGLELLEPIPWSVTGSYDPAGRERAIFGCKSGCAAVLSYHVPPGHELERELAGRSFVYDDALAMLVHLAEGRPEQALPIGRTLVALQNGDHTIGFSFDFTEPAFVDSGYVRAGVVAWVGYALATYDRVTHTHTFRDEARSVADRLLQSRFTSGPREGLVAAGRGRWLEHSTVFDAPYVADYAVTEHQIDTYFFLRVMEELEPGSYGAAANALAASLLRAAWIEEEDMFSAGVDVDGRSDDRALDAAGAWGALFLLAIGDRPRAERSFAATDRAFASVVRGFHGYAPYAGVVSDYVGRDFSRTFFSEGTAGMGVLLARTGRMEHAHAVAETLAKLRKNHGGAVPYAFPASEDFPELPALAPTAWLRLLERELATSSPFVFATPRVAP